MESKAGEQGWDRIAREQLEETNNLQKKAELVAVVMQEGFANICFVTQYHTILRQKVELAVPKKLVSQRATERTHFPILHTTSVLSGIAPALLRQFLHWHDWFWQKVDLLTDHGRCFVSSASFFSHH
jgi:eRF1 domain 2